MRLIDKAILTPAGHCHPHRFPFRFIKSIGLYLNSAGTGLNFLG
jgi:hypothetical protein